MARTRFSESRFLYFALVLTAFASIVVSIVLRDDPSSKPAMFIIIEIALFGAFAFATSMPLMSRLSQIAAMSLVFGFFFPNSQTFLLWFVCIMWVAVFLTAKDERDPVALIPRRAVDLRPSASKVAPTDPTAGPPVEADIVSRSKFAPRSEGNPDS